MSKKNTSKFDFFEIDINRLDEEWINQPKFYHKYSKMLTNAKEEAERCRARVDIANDDRKAVRAGLSLKIRKKPKKFFGSSDKPTESAITNRIIIHPKYRASQQEVYDANDDVIEANKKVSTCYSAVFTLDHRKAALERLVVLFGQDYFSSPRAKDENSKQFQDETLKREVRRKKKRSQE